MRSRLLIALAPLALLGLTVRDAGAQTRVRHLPAGTTAPSTSGKTTSSGTRVERADRDDHDEHADHEGKGKKGKKPKKQKVTADHALDVTRVVLVEQGYRVVRVESLGGSRVVYYCLGNRGRGKGCGPVQKLYVRPSAETVVFESAPRPVLMQLNLRLGL